MKPLLLVLTLCAGGVSLWAQSPLQPLPARLASDTLPTVRQYFELSPAHRKAVVSLYKTINFLDSRADTSSVGMAEITDNAVIRMVLQTPVQPQLAAMLTACSSPNPGDGELLMQMRRLSFAEPLGVRYFYVAASLYAKCGDRYMPLGNLDTTLLIYGNIRKEVGIATEDMLYELLTACIGTKPSGSVSYSLDELGRLDSLEKQRLPLYAQSSYVDGLYSTYTAFRDQAPDLEGEAKLDHDGRVIGVKVKDKQWNAAQRESGHVQHEHIYAVVYKGAPYAVTYLGVWPLEKIGSDFYFTGKLKVVASNDQRNGAAIMFGLSGVIARNALGAKMVCRVMLDHQNGELIHRRILAVE